MRLNWNFGPGERNAMKKYTAKVARIVRSAASSRAWSPRSPIAARPASPSRRSVALSTSTWSIEPCESRVLMSAAPNTGRLPPSTGRTPPNTGAAPVAPAIVATVKGPTSVAISWTDKDTSITGYNVLRSTDGTNFTTLTHLTTAKTLSYTDATAASDTQYTYEVQALNAGGTTTTSSPATAHTPLKPITSLVAHATSGSNIALTWVDNDTNATGYLVLRSTDGKTYTQIANLQTADAHTYSDATVASGKAYYYEVQAYETTHQSAVVPSGAAPTPLGTPAGVSATVLTASSVKITWTGSDPSATGYLILRSTAGGAYVSVGKSAGVSASSFTDGTALPFHTYSYEVEATNAVSISSASSAATVSTPLATPAAVTVKATSPSAVNITWVDTDAAPAGFYVLRATGSDSYHTIATITNAKLRSYIDATPASNKSYSYEVQAYSGTNSSAASTAASVTTPLVAPSGLAAAQSGSSVALTWTDNDSTATGYTIYRSVNAGKTYSLLITLSSGTAAAYTDSTTGSGTAYTYEVVATAGSNTSVASAAASVITTLGAPTGLAAAATGGSLITVTWSKSDAATTGYIVYRSTNGGAYAQLAKITSAATTTLKDGSVASATTYSYKVAAFDAAATSSLTDGASATTSLNAPSKLVATPLGSFVNLKWTANDTGATGYTILRSTDGTNYASAGTVASVATTTFADVSVTAGTTYYYEVVATKGSISSAATAPVSIVATAGGSNGAITISTRYTNELVITAAGTSDSVAISQSGSTLTIVADGQTYAEPVPAAGVFVYTRGGSDSVSIDASVTAPTTIEGIDGAATAVTSHGSDVSAWLDATDTFVGTGTLHSVGTFTGGTAKTLGAALPNPKDAGTTTTVTGESLWGTGPVAGDVNQGSVGDCYFMSSLAAFAGTQPATLQQSAVDMGDGTYTVQFDVGGTDKYYRVSNQFPTGGFGAGFKYAYSGTTGDIWAMVLEKAYAYARTGANTYASLNSGWMGSVYAYLGANSTNIFMSDYSADASFYSVVSAALTAGDPVTFGTLSPPNLVGSHAYTLVCINTNSDGTHTYTVRNPWGTSGDSLENSQGYATLTFSQMKVNFYDGCVAST